MADRLKAAGSTVIHEVSMPLTWDERDGRMIDRIRVDHLVILERFEDGTFRGRFVESKGRDLTGGRVKREAFEAKYDLDVQVITK